MLISAALEPPPPQSGGVDTGRQDWSFCRLRLGVSTAAGGQCCHKSSNGKHELCPQEGWWEIPIGSASSIWEGEGIGHTELSAQASLAPCLGYLSSHTMTSWQEQSLGVPNLNVVIHVHPADSAAEVRTLSRDLMLSRALKTNGYLSLLSLPGSGKQETAVTPAPGCCYDVASPQAQVFKPLVPR